MLARAVEGDLLSAARATDGWVLGARQPAAAASAGGGAAEAVLHTLFEAVGTPPGVRSEVASMLGALPPRVRLGLDEILRSFDRFRAAVVDGASRAELFAARRSLLAASLAFPHVPPAAGRERMAFDACPVLAVDLDGEATTYHRDCVLIIDAGGDDTYLNNAGGDNLSGGSCDFFDLGGAAAVIDLDGDDVYGDPDAPRSCGANGGSILGAGFLFDGAGDDAYHAGFGGTNGGAVLRGSGFLADLGGSDTYRALSGGTNGGVAENGTGGLLDWDGDDSYSAGAIGTNGGAIAFQCGVCGAYASAGFLIDRAGDDEYVAEDIATNGGAWGDTVGALVDGGGDDVYVADRTSVNGGGGSLLAPAVGLLLDLGGTDSYTDDEGGTGTDKTVVPKRQVGAQVDVP